MFLGPPTASVVAQDGPRRETWFIGRLNLVIDRAISWRQGKTPAPPLILRCLWEAIDSDPLRESESHR